MSVRGEGTRAESTALTEKNGIEKWHSVSLIPAEPRTNQSISGCTTLSSK